MWSVSLCESWAHKVSVRSQRDKHCFGMMKSLIRGKEQELAVGVCKDKGFS